MRWGVIQPPDLSLDSVQSIKQLRSPLFKYFSVGRWGFMIGVCVPQSSYFYQDISGLFRVEGVICGKGNLSKMHRFCEPNPNFSHTSTPLRWDFMLHV